MKRSKRIYILLGVLVAVCLATFTAVNLEKRQERIQNSEEVILSIEPESVQSLSWSYDDISLAFTKDENDVWHWEEDDAFPVSEEKMNELLDLFSAFGVSFIIEEVEDYGQYGLDTPVCTIELETAEQSYTVQMGDFSKLDSQRYVSIGDGNVYLVSTDPMDTYEITIRDIIDNDPALDYDTVTAINFDGTEDWSIEYAEESTNSVCSSDVYFTDDLPLDTSRVDDYLSNMKMLDLTDYVSYNATEEELETYGLNDPELTVTVDYTIEAENEEEEFTEDSYTLQISRSAEERARAAETSDAEDSDEKEENSYVAYARVGSSPIIYEISSSSFESLMAAGYDDLRHQEVVTADFSIVTSIDIILEGKTYTLSAQIDEDDEENSVWLYEGAETEITDVQSALEELRAVEFTGEQPGNQEEIALTIHLDHEYFPEIQVVLYRYDGSNCLATVDGEPFALVPRSDVVDLIEAVNAIVLE